VKKDNNDSFINLSLIEYINNNNNKSKNLLILVNEGRAHFKVGYYNNNIYY